MILYLANYKTVVFSIRFQGQRSKLPKPKSGRSLIHTRLSLASPKLSSMAMMMTGSRPEKKRAVRVTAPMTAQVGFLLQNNSAAGSLKGMLLGLIAESGVEVEEEGKRSITDGRRPRDESPNSRKERKKAFREEKSAKRKEKVKKHIKKRKEKVAKTKK